MFVFKATAVLGLTLAVGAVEFVFKNNEQGPVWIGIQGNDGREPLAEGGFVLETGAQVSSGAVVREERAIGWALISW